LFSQNAFAPNLVTPQSRVTKGEGGLVGLIFGPTCQVAQLRTSGQLPKESALFLRMNAKHSRSETTDDRANNNNSISNGVNFLLVADGGTVGRKNKTNE